MQGSVCTGGVRADNKARQRVPSGVSQRGAVGRGRRGDRAAGGSRGGVSGGPGRAPDGARGGGQPGGWAMSERVILGGLALVAALGWADPLRADVIHLK